MVLRNWPPRVGMVLRNSAQEGGMLVKTDMWPPDRILELAPAFWKQTIQQQDTQQRLAANVFRTVTLADHPSTM